MIDLSPESPARNIASVIAFAIIVIIVVARSRR